MVCIHFHCDIPWDDACHHPRNRRNHLRRRLYRGHGDARENMQVHIPESTGARHGLCWQYPARGRTHASI